MAHIFVVDDDEQLLRMVGLMLERGGHTATLVSNPIEALAMMREEPPALAILDVMMPTMNGLELCRELRVSKSTRNVPIIILTARGPIEDRQEALEIGADTYLNKPVTSLELLNNVDGLLARSAAASALAAENGDDDVEDEPPAVLEDGPQMGRTIALYGLTGGVGRTTLAVNLASYLQSKGGGNVCLVDLTSSGGQAAMHMRLQPRQGWGNLLAQSELSFDTISAQIIEHGSGLHLLAAPLMPISPDVLTVATVEMIVSEIVANYSTVIFDLPPVISPVVKYVLGAADVCLHVFKPEVISVQTAVRVERHIQSKGPHLAQKMLVLNQPTAEVQLGRATVERGLNGSVDFHIPFDKAQSKAMVQGAPLATGLADSTIASCVADIAKTISRKRVTNG